MIFKWFFFLGLPEARLVPEGPQDLRDRRVLRAQLAHKGLQDLQDPLARQEQQGRRVHKG